MARVANFAYCLPRNKIGNATKRKDIIANIWERPNDSKALFVYFKGPRLSKNEWLGRQFNVSSIEVDEKILVDTVWLEHTKQMMPALIGELNEKIREKSQLSTTKLYFVGHGVGGAYAVLAAFFVHEAMLGGTIIPDGRLKASRIGIITFGAPRVGNLNFVNSIARKFNNKNIFRVTHSNDWLPREFLPKGQFLHHETEFWLDDCDCFSSHKGHKIFKCVQKNLEEIDENQECNLGSIGSEEYNISQVNQGPYFGITFGNCTGINPAFYLN
ncbi:hypothetical protein G9A89_014720 [Geosiphon pyriformis]|nr:hypothetical protein G9A89_014720 [Geosiphon pyriformis]